MEKVCVNGPHTHEVYKFLRTRASVDGVAHAIGWNFCMFLVSRDGLSARRIPAASSPATIKDDVALLVTNNDIAVRK